MCVCISVVVTIVVWTTGDSFCFRSTVASMTCTRRYVGRTSFSNCKRVHVLFIIRTITTGTGVCDLSLSCCFTFQNDISSNGLVDRKLFENRVVNGTYRKRRKISRDERADL